MLDVASKVRKIDNELFEKFTQSQLINVQNQLLAIANGNQTVILTAPQDWSDNMITSFEEAVNGYIATNRYKIRIIMLPPGFGCACHFRSNGCC